MSNPGSITILVDQLRSGDDLALERLFAHFFERLRAVARHRVTARDRKILDDEDLAICAIDAFQQAIRAGLYSELGNREEVWRFLVAIVERQSVDHLRKLHAVKRGGGNVRGESVFEEHDEGRALENLCIDALNMEVMTDFLDAIDSIVQKLDDPELAEIVAARIAGHTNDEIATQLGKSVSSVERKLRLVRSIISQEQLQ